MANENSESKLGINAILADQAFRLSQNDLLKRELESRREELAQQHVAMEEERRALMEAQIKERENYERMSNRLKAQLDAKRAEIEKSTDELERQRIALMEKDRARRDAYLDARRKFEEEKDELERQRSEFESEKLKYDAENNAKLQTNSTQFVKSVVAELRIREESLSKSSQWWSMAGAAASAVALLIIGYALFKSLTNFSEPSWRVIVFSAAKGSIFVALLGIASKYSFQISKRYLDESLNFSRIIHNISFGQLYVESYGATAGWEQVKEAFSNWSAIEKEPQALEQNANEAMTTVDLSSVAQLVDAVSKLKS